MYFSFAFHVKTPSISHFASHATCLTLQNVICVHIHWPCDNNRTPYDFGRIWFAELLSLQSSFQ
jgi:hypothetical protein